MRLLKIGHRERRVPLLEYGNVRFIATSSRRLPGTVFLYRLLRNRVKLHLPLRLPALPLVRDAVLRKS